MTTAVSELEQLIAEGDILELGARASAARRHRVCGYYLAPVEDGALHLFTDRTPQAELPEIATLVYDQETPVETVLRDLEQLATRPRLASVLLLPAAPGDQILVPGATTWGNRDVAFLAAARLLLPGHVHVRASIGALGWKLAQPTLAFGVDELSGWDVEERQAYGPRARPASTVSEEELRQGILEAGLSPLEVTRCDWAS